MKKMNVFERFIAEKFWGRKDGGMLLTFIVLNPMLMVVIEFLLGFQYVCGIMTAVAALIFLKTKWSE